MDVRGKDACGRSAGDQRHLACPQEWLPVVRLSAGIRPSEDDLQSLCPLGGTRSLGATVPRTRRARARHGDTDDRLHAHQGPSLGIGRKRGEHKQAIGRSRGGRNTKIHAIADAKGRLLSILLTGGEAHDCPPAQRLIRRTRAAKKLLGDQSLRQRGAARLAPGRGTSPSSQQIEPQAPSASTSRPTNRAIASRTPSAGSKTSAGSPPATTGWPETTSPPSASSLLSYGGFNEFVRVTALISVRHEDSGAAA